MLVKLKKWIQRNHLNKQKYLSGYFVDRYAFVFVNQVIYDVAKVPASPNEIKSVIVPVGNKLHHA